MNEAYPPLSQGQRVSAKPLAARPAFPLGNLLVRPSLLSIEGPGGVAKAEPRVMRVLVALADAAGAVLSRDELLEQCWDGLIVGDDAINRAIGELRRLVTVAGGDIEVETVPRVGYRLAGAAVPPLAETGSPQEAGASPVPRRAVLAGGAALAAAALGGVALYRNYSREAELDALVERGRVLQASGDPGAADRAVSLFRRVVEAEPARADAWGWLAAVHVGQPEALALAQRALSLDPGEPNARSVLAVQRLDLDDWITYEDTLLGIVRDAPRCALALSELTLFYQGMGRCRESLGFNERAIAIEPFNPTHQSRRAMKHWIFGDLAKADQVANRALQLWPRNPVAWNARMITLAYTARPDAARALLENGQLRPANLSAPTVEAWRATLEAVADGTVDGARRAVPGIMAAATVSPGMAANAVMALSYLGLLDECYRVADGLLTQRGGVIQQGKGSLAQDLYSGPAWGRTQFVFVPACANLRADARFTDLSRRTGLLAYWSARGVKPDPFVKGSLTF